MSSGSSFDEGGESSGRRSGIFGRLLGGNASRAELYGIAVLLFVLTAGTVSGAVVIASSNDGESSATTSTVIDSATTTVQESVIAAEVTTETTASTTSTREAPRTVTTDALGGPLPAPVPADRCLNTFTVPDLYGLQQWQVANVLGAGGGNPYFECGPVTWYMFGYTLDGERVAGGYDCPDGTPLTVISQEPAAGTTWTIQQLVSMTTSYTWGPCPGVVIRVD